MSEDLTVRDHAIDRYRQRTGAKHTRAKVARKLLRIASQGREVAVADSLTRRISRLATDSACRRIRLDSSIVVVEDGEITTFYFDTRGRHKALEGDKP